jgi:predicted nucleic acid-binding Zn ribbon protein
MREDGPTVCELCGGELRRVLFPSGIIFKGAGFYRNDSRSSTSSPDSGSEKPAAATSDGATATPKTEKKSDTSGTTKPASSE